MSVNAYVGLPGSGKSHSVVEYVILPALKQGRRVFTNVPMHQDKLREDLNCEVVQIDIKDVVENDNWFSEVFEAGAILVLDEVWRLWPAGLTQKQAKKQHQEFLAEHRHLVGEDGYSTDIILVTQDLSQISSFARSLVESTVQTVNLKGIGLPKKFKVFWYFGAVTGQKPPKSKVEKVSTLQSYKKDVYKYYISHTKSKVGAGAEVATDKRSNILLSSKTFMGLAFVVACLFFIYWAFGYVAKGFGVDSIDDSAQTQQLDKGSYSSKPNSNSNPRPVPKPKPKPKHDDFFIDIDRIYITYNNGFFPNIDYRFKVEHEDYQTVMTMKELASLNYKVKPINDCLVKLTINETDRYIMCYNYDKEPSGFFQETVTNVVPRG